MTTTTTPAAADLDPAAALRELFGTERTGACVYVGQIRADATAAMVAAAQAAAAKVARRIPGVTVEVHTEPYLTAKGELPTWCLSHRVFGCSESSNEYAVLRCHHVVTAGTSVDIRVHGLPMWDGEWFVGGVLTRDDNGAVKATTVGVDSDDMWARRHADLMGDCAHCRTRRNRNLTVLLRSGETGEIRPVGRNCLTEYTGGAIRAEVLTELTALRERFAAATGGVFESLSDSAPTAIVVALAARYVALHGYVRSGEYGLGIQPTADRVRGALGWTGKGERPAVLPVDLTADDTAAAVADIELVLSSTETDSSYIANLIEVATPEWAQFTGRRNAVGLLASLPGAAERMRTRRVETVIEPSRVNAWIGEEGTRREFTGTLVSVRFIDNEFGGSDLVIIDTPEGTVKIFGKAAAAHDFAPGDTMTVVGRITDHEEWKGLRQTRITRVKITPKG